MLSFPLSATTELRWFQADHDVHVAHAGDEYAGHLTIDADGTTAYDAIGRVVGVYADDARAKSALEDARASATARPVSETRRRRRRTSGLRAVNAASRA
ncbi:hypothetical protein AB0N73_09395 [Microbacterium sp. NPDC089189]|uniref:hypothetical protein n=1 Tax=Microbacterium sp. NPDC089189 TaxID=3154972 RepID=UPI00342527E4